MNKKLSHIILKNQISISSCPKLNYQLLNILILLIFCINISAQNDSDYIAKVGNHHITVQEFLNRYEFMPHLNYSSDNIDTLKKEFLYSLIAEKLWAFEGLEKGFDTLDVVKNSLKTLEKLFVRDELFRSEVESKITLSSESISKGLLNIARTLYFNIITSSDSNEIFSVYNQLIARADFDSLLKSRPEYNSQQKPFQIKLGTLKDEITEEKLFELKPNQISKPIKSNSNWYLFKLVDEEIDSSLLNNTETARNKTITILTERQRKKIAGNFLDKILGGRIISANSELFNYLSELLIKHLDERYSHSNTDENKNYDLIPFDLMRLIKTADVQKLNSLFVEIDSTKLTLKDFIYYLLYQKISFPSLKPNKIKSTINAAVKQFIEDELITLEGFRRGLNNLLSVKEDIDMWRSYYLSELMMQSFSDSIKVSKKEIEDYISQKFQNSSNRILLNIIEIYNTQLDEILAVLEELSKGKDFKDLARKYNRREYTKKSDGEWGYFLANSGGEIGKIASTLEVGQIYGPIKVNDGYSIFKLIDKKILNDSLLKVNDEPEEYIKMKLSLLKINNLLNRKTAELAQKYGIQINENILNNTTVSNLNMFTYRLIGFGGKIAAMPITIPIFEWYYLIYNKSEIP